MIRRILSLLPSIAVIFAAAYLAGVGLQEDVAGIQALLFYAAAVAVAVPSALDVRTRVKEGLGLSTKARASLEAAMKSVVLRLHRENLRVSEAASLSGALPYPEDITKLGFHVWLVPKRRRLIPYAFRTRVCRSLSEEVLDWRVFNPRLRRAAAYTVDERRVSADVRVGRGRGIIGTCLKANDTDGVVRVNWTRSDRRALLQNGDRRAWKDAAFDVNLGLPFDDAMALSRSYGQAAAMVIRKSGSLEPIGCVTLDLPPGASAIDLEDVGAVSTQRLLSYLRDVRDQVQEISGL